MINPNFYSLKFTTIDFMDVIHSEDSGMGLANMRHKNKNFAEQMDVSHHNIGIY
jgi:hypothetical protein